ncbi:hypothetical protein Pla123a_16580 [Posidoniimonas polymericola]|uniref:Uncharacterized protein n=1 Tax=Posidoniimonas polymericola TaxID=2528002 RepID=A0A5C5YSX2_9BACT|nr:hypothetical protein [Posidoniimonas polymericola]TWT77860.1 hypothetical protein Pla123a_16580 [Posidoniimonas polymericola]
MLKKTAASICVLLLAGAGYYFASRAWYVGRARAAFPELPIDSHCYFLPWPMGPEVIGQLAVDDPRYVYRETVVRESRGLLLSIADSSGHFIIRPE